MDMAQHRRHCAGDRVTIVRQTSVANLPSRCHRSSPPPAAGYPACHRSILLATRRRPSVPMRAKRRQPVARRHADRAAQPPVGAGRVLGHRCRAHDGRARHLHRAAVAGAVDSAERRAPRQQSSTTPNCGRSTSTRTPAAMRPRGTSFRRTRRVGATAACSRSRALLARVGAAPACLSVRRAALPVSANAASRALVLDELRRARCRAARAWTCRKTNACARCARPCWRRRHATRRWKPGPRDTGASPRTVARLFRCRTRHHLRRSGASRCCWPRQCRWPGAGCR